MKTEETCECGCPHWKHGRNPGDKFLHTGKCDTPGCDCTGFKKMNTLICDKCNAEIADGECNCTWYAEHPEAALVDSESLALTAKIRELVVADFPEVEEQ